MLSTTISATIGTKLYEEQCIALRLRYAQLPVLDKIEMIFPASVTFTASVGDDCSVELDTGDWSGQVFSGIVGAIRYESNGLRIIGYNSGYLLSRYRPAVSLEQMSSGEVITTLCSDVSVSSGEISDGPPLSLYLSDGKATAASEIARLALLGGCWGAFDADNVLHVNENGGAGEEIALKYGRELLSVTLAETVPNDNTITVVGEGGGDPSSPEARWIIKDFLNGSAEDAGVGQVRVQEPELRTTDDAQNSSNAYMQQRAVHESLVNLTTWLNPRILPGSRLECHEMPDHLPITECRVLQVTSTILPGKRATTDIKATALVDGSALPGALAGVGGGLL